MAPVHYTGALQPKKKSELQEIAGALNLNDQGTKDELQFRIKKHLDDHQSELEDDPVFAGLLGRRKRSVQPQSAPAATRASDSTTTTETKPTSRSGRRSGVALEPVPEATPAKEPRDVSAYLKHPVSPVDSTPTKSPRHAAEAASSPSSLPPLPSSPAPPTSPAKSLIENIKTADVAGIVQDVKKYDILQNTQESLTVLREFLSNSRNIFFLTVVYELMYIFYAVVPWRTVQLPLSPKGTVSLPLIYPPPSTFQASAFWIVLLHWSIPAVLAPTIFGTLISFNPTVTLRQREAANDAAGFDPLTASIVRLAAQIAYPFCALDAQSGVCGLDVLGSKFRVWNASVGLAFAFAETISGAPQAFAQTLRRDRRFLTPSRQSTPMPVTAADA